MMALSWPECSPVHTNETSPVRTGPYSETTCGDQLRINAFDHADDDIAFDPLSTNRRFPTTTDLAVLGTLVFGAPTRESIDVMFPDCLLPLVGGEVHVDLHHPVLHSAWDRPPT